MVASTKLRLTIEQKIAQEQPAMEAGRQGKPLKDMLEGIKKYSNLWHRMRGAWRQGRHLQDPSC